jgi:death-on-curing protein
MPEPTWIELDVVLAVHDEQLAEHGGQPGVRDRGLLESALARPRNQFAYGEQSIARLAASYAFGISRNHPFLDGNKRTSLVVTELFLELNEVELAASNAECVTTFLRLAAGDLHEDDLAAWIATHSSPRPSGSHHDR